MHQLMGQRPAPFVGPGCERAGAENDVIADGECASLDRSRRTRGGGASVDAYRRKIVAQAGLHFCPRRGIQGLASIVQYGEDLWSGSAGQGWGRSVAPDSRYCPLGLRRLFLLPGTLARAAARRTTPAGTISLQGDELRTPHWDLARAQQTWRGPGDASGWRHSGRNAVTRMSRLDAQLRSQTQLGGDTLLRGGDRHKDDGNEAASLPRHPARPGGGRVTGDDVRRAGLRGAGGHPRPANLRTNQHRPSIPA
jgi:hypothetical protein